jgi:hypothetical protein
MIGALCALCYNQPAKLASIVLFLPSFLCAAFIDAYPAEGRAGTSRLFFALSLIGLVLLHAGLAFGITRIDELLCVYLDEHVLRVLRAVHGFLMEHESSAGEAGNLASSTVQGAIGVTLAGM